MFRVVFMTFHGTVPSEPHPHGEPEAGHHAPHLHDAPPAMAIALVVLAIGSAVAGYAGLPRVLGGENRIEHFLAPSFTATESAGQALEAAAPVSAEQGEGLELRLMLVSILAALAGIGIAAFFLFGRAAREPSTEPLWGSAPCAPEQMHSRRRALPGGHRRAAAQISEQGLWRAVDVGFIDGAVNGVGTIVRAGAARLRLMQTGSCARMRRPLCGRRRDAGVLLVEVNSNGNGNGRPSTLLLVARCSSLVADSLLENVPHS